MKTHVAMATIVEIEGPQRNNRNKGQNNQGNNSRRQYKRNDGRQHQGNNPQNQIPNPNRARQPPSCALCDLVKENDVPKPYVDLDFTDIHDTVMDKQPLSNQCLSWMILSMDERIKVLQKSELYCQVCMRLLSKEAAASGRPCINGKHIPNTGRNGLCIEQSCSYDATICKQHEQGNRENHQRIKKANVWRNERAQ